MPTYEEQKRLAGYDPRVNFSLTQTPVVSSPLPDVGSLNHTAKTWLQRVFKSEQLYVAAECSIRNNEFCSQLARIFDLQPILGSRTTILVTKNIEQVTFTPMEAMNRPEHIIFIAERHLCRVLKDLLLGKLPDGVPAYKPQRLRRAAHSSTVFTCESPELVQLPRKLDASVSSSLNTMPLPQNKAKDRKRPKDEVDVAPNATSSEDEDGGIISEDDAMDIDESKIESAREPSPQNRLSPQNFTLNVPSSSKQVSRVARSSTNISVSKPSPPAAPFDHYETGENVSSSIPGSSKGKQRHLSPDLGFEDPPKRRKKAPVTASSSSRVEQKPLIQSRLPFQYTQGKKDKIVPAKRSSSRNTDRKNSKSITPSTDPTLAQYETQTKENLPVPIKKSFDQDVIILSDTESEGSAKSLERPPTKKHRTEAR